MRDNISDLASWPTRRNKEPILKSTNEAYLYAQLIYQSEDHQKALTFHRQQTFKVLQHEREKEHRNFDRMMELACRAQFYRECLEEVARITAEYSDH